MAEGGVGKQYLLHQAIKFSLEKLGKSGLTIKPQQTDAIYELAINSRDVLAVLPTGFGKSLIFQILPFVFDFLDGKSSASSVIIISPLNGLIRDQIEKLKTYMTVGVLQVSSIVHDDSGDDDWDPTPSEQLLNSQLLLAHPEVFVDNKKLLNKFAHNERLQKRIKLIVVDEAHLISEWNDLRPAYGKLGLFSTVFPSSPKLALTASPTRAIACEQALSL